MPKEYLDHLSANRRLALLRLLVDTGGSANESVIHQSLELLGFRRTARDTIRDDIRFLEENGSIKTNWYGTVQVCDITKRGVDIADGRIQVEGVKPPSIGI